MPDPRIFPVPRVLDYFATVLGVSTLVSVAKPERVDCDLVNDSDDTIYLARGNEAVVGSGIRLNARGGSYHMNVHNLFLGDINGISTGQDSNLTISEGVKP